MGKDDLLFAFRIRLQDSIKRLSGLKVGQRIRLTSIIGTTIDSFVKEKGDPFRTLTDSLGPTFENITSHEKNFELLIDELRETSTGFGKLVKDQAIYTNLTVRLNHRVTINELPDGTVLRKTIYRSKRGVPCPECDGTGDESLLPGKARKCKHCKNGTLYPVKGVMLEVM